MKLVLDILSKNGLVVAFLVTGCILWLSYLLSDKLLRKKIPGSAIAIVAGLVLAYVGGSATGGSKGISDISWLSGMGIMGGAMFRDFAIVSTAQGVHLEELRGTGWVGAVSLLLGITISFVIGTLVALSFGYRDPKDLATIGAGACTFIVGPVTGAAVKASSEVIAVSIAAGVVKSVVVTLITPIFARQIGLDNPRSAMVYGGLMGTTSGVAAGLAATDPKLVPYGAMTATFFTGLGCLLCPSVFYLILTYFFGS
ncbi:MAG TPA: malonate transporter subunit MadM [Cytophagales bacterium]|nr:malonate transporter subunit MadM [Cytophagales bacterium]